MPTDYASLEATALGEPTGQPAGNDDDENI